METFGSEKEYAPHWVGSLATVPNDIRSFSLLELEVSREFLIGLFQDLG